MPPLIEARHTQHAPKCAHRHAHCMHTACTLRVPCVALCAHMPRRRAAPRCHLRLQPFSHTVAASLTHGCSLSHLWLQACGTLDFMAPEMLADDPAYEAKADVWSAGVLVYMLLSGSHPFRGPSQCATEERIKAGQLPSDRAGEGIRGVSSEARAFVKALLVLQPGARLSAKEALGHPWLRLQRNNADAPLLDAGVPAKVKALVETGAAAEPKSTLAATHRSAGPPARPALHSGPERSALAAWGPGGETAIRRALRHPPKVPRSLPLSHYLSIRRPLRWLGRGRRARLANLRRPPQRGQACAPRPRQNCQAGGGQNTEPRGRPGQR